MGPDMVSPVDASRMLRCAPELTSSRRPDKASSIINSLLPWPALTAANGVSLSAVVAWWATLLSLGSKPAVVITEPAVTVVAGSHGSGRACCLPHGRGRGLGGEQRLSEPLSVGKENPVRLSSQCTVVLGGGQRGSLLAQYARVLGAVTGKHA